MSRATAIFLLLLIFLLPVVAGSANIQTNNSHPGLSQNDLDAYLRQSEQLIRFMEYAFNTLGDPEVSPREKDIIINQSFLKFFVSEKVQIEDDLIEGRFTVTNKNVQAYLKDIDFFFKNVVFAFSIEDISYQVNDKGQVFFVVTATRNLSGLGVEGDTVFNNQTRFIEINLDRDKRDLKIASIYTTKLSEKEDMRNWWAELNSDWRLIFAQGTLIDDNYPLKDIHDFDDGWILIERFQVTEIEGYILESRKTDTLLVNTTRIYQEIGKIWKTESLDISVFPYITEISPLSKLNELRSLNISGTHVDDLIPIRNLTRLESLDVSKTMVTTLAPLRYAINLKNLNISQTGIEDLEAVRAFPALERLNISSTHITFLDPLSESTALLDLRLYQTEVTDITPISNLPNLLVLDITGSNIMNIEALSTLQSLSRLHADNTAITDLKPLSGLQNLQYIFIEGTLINDLIALQNMPSLRRIYCDRTGITHEIANRFMQENPDVLVIFESQALTSWWKTLAPEWQNIFHSVIPVASPPTREELHEIAKITHLDITGNSRVLSLSPLQKLRGLRVLNASHTGIISIEPLKENIDLIELDISSTHVHDIKVLSNLRILEKLKLAHTPVSDITPLANSSQLKYIDLDFTNVNSIQTLASLRNLEMVLCDGLNIDYKEVKQIYSYNPHVTVIFQTQELNDWWHSLSEPWLSVFKRHIALDSPPTRLQLQRLIDLKELEISNMRGLESIQPLSLFHRLEVLRMGNVHIHDLSPLKYHHNLKELYCNDNPISDLRVLRKLSEITVLDCSNTLVRNLGDLGSLHNLQVLNIAGTQVRNLRPLSNLHSLRQLDCFNTGIRSLRPLENLSNLELLRCYNTRLWPWSISRFAKAVPGCEIIYY